MSLQLTGKMDWSLIRWIKKNVLLQENICPFTILVWNYEYGRKRIQIEATDGKYAEDAEAYASACSEFNNKRFFEVNSEDYINEFLRQFIKTYYTLNNTKILCVGAGGLGEDTLWGKPFEYDTADKYATIIQRHWRKIK
jgi:hypothetical protein